MGTWTAAVVVEASGARLETDLSRPTAGATAVEPQRSSDSAAGPSAAAAAAAVARARCARCCVRPFATLAILLLSIRFWPVSAVSRVVGV